MEVFQNSFASPAISCSVDLVGEEIVPQTQLHEVLITEDFHDIPNVVKKDLAIVNPRWSVLVDAEMNPVEVHEENFEVVWTKSQKKKKRQMNRKLTIVEPANTRARAATNKNSQ